MKYDVLIIGGGIAGLSLSIDLAKRGHSVVLIEKGNYPRHKVCGEYISIESHDYLNKLCPPLSTLPLPMIKNFKLSSTGKKQFKTQLDLGGFGVSRYLLEKLLFEEATKQGVVFMLNNRVTEITHDSTLNEYEIKTKTGKVNASLICNASGRRSNLETNKQASAAKGANYIGVKYHIKLQRDPSLIEIHNFPGGYCGISNVEENISCLCYIVNSEN